MSPLRYLRWALPAALLLASPILAGTARGDITGEAIIGRPFGVAKVTFSGADVGSIDERLCRIEEKNGRAFYPTVMPGLFGRLFNQVLGGPDQGAAGQVTIHFLFRGEEPLEMTIFTPKQADFTIRPKRENERVYNRMLEKWWSDYQSVAIGDISKGDHPPLATTYLQTMLSRRLNQPFSSERGPLGRPKTPTTTPAAATTNQSLELLMGMEDLRLRTIRDSMLGRNEYGQQTMQPIPAGMAWPPASLPMLEGDVPVEAIAAHVPPEYFYIRFGKFLNYIWLSDLMNEYGGDIGSMVTMRGYASPMNKRVQDQLGLQQNELAKVLGPNIISDVALIGQDLYMVDGAAMGILFEAKATELLEDDIQKQRKRAVEREKDNGGKLETIKIRGRDVSFASSADNRLRSFYLRDGNYHLVTTSRTIAERFITVSEQKGISLADSAEFRHARTILPLVREDTIFVYFSKSFFEGLLTPEYQIELRRRMEAATDLDLLRFARLAAKGEGYETDKFDPMIEAGFLPASFGRRPDGSEPVIKGEELLDSRRGARGSFLPIADVRVVEVTAEEARFYNDQAKVYRDEWKVMDPLMVGIKRFELPKNPMKLDVDQPVLERITIDGNISPLNEAKYGRVMEMLGPPTTQMIARDPNDIVSVQASVKEINLIGNIPPHQLFLGVQDVTPLLEKRSKGIFGTLQMLQNTPGYFGSYPKAGYLEMLPLGIFSARPDENGFSQLPFGLWRREGGGFSVLSFDAELLAKITPSLRVTEAEIPAQIRIHVGDLSTAKVAPLINKLYFDRALTTSSGNVRFLHMLNQQLKVPLPDCVAVGQDILNAQFNCPLGGEYKLHEVDGNNLYWQSSAWEEKVPEDYRAPVLEWFRGLDGHLTKQQGRLIAHLELDLARKPSDKPPAAEFKLPLFDLFGGQKAFKPSEKAPKEGELPPPLPSVPEPPKKPKGKEF